MSPSAIWRYALSLFANDASDANDASPPEPSDAEPAAPPAPPRPVSLVHILFTELEKHAAGHPMLRMSLQWIDDLVDERGEALIADLEAALLNALAIRHPAMVPVVAAILAAKQQPPASAGQIGAGGPDTAPPAKS